MGGGNNLSSCLELLEDQGFKAEHQPFVKMISCMNAYWNKDTFGPDQNTFDPSGIVGTAIEEGELELANETISSEPDFLKIFSKQEKKRKCKSNQTGRYCSAIRNAVTLSSVLGTWYSVLSLRSISYKWMEMMRKVKMLL